VERTRPGVFAFLGGDHLGPDVHSITRKKMEAERTGSAVIFPGVRILEKALLSTTAQPDFRAKMEAAGFVPQGMGIEESKKFLEAEAIVIKQLAKDFDLQKQ
jgi:hypothetical protein